MTKDLNGKVVAVTGAASGIGLATSQVSIGTGATVAMVDRDEKAVTEQAHWLGANATLQRTDLLDTDSCDRMLPDIIEAADRIDLLHCNTSS